MLPAPPLEASVRSQDGTWQRPAESGRSSERGVMEMVSTSIETELLGMGLARGQRMMRCTVTYEQMSAEFGVSCKIHNLRAVSKSVKTVLMVRDVMKGRSMMRRRTMYVHMRKSGDQEMDSRILSVCVRKLLAPEFFFILIDLRLLANLATCMRTWL